MAEETETLTTENSSGVDGTPGADQPGAQPPADQPPGDSPPGQKSETEDAEPTLEQLKADLEKATAERDTAKTAAETSATAAKTSDAEAQRHRETIARGVLQKATEERQTTERAARAVDDKSVEDGDLTASEATQRAETRQVATAKADEEATRLQTLEQQNASMIAAATVNGREMYAVEYAKEFDVDKAALMDPAFKTPEEMKLKARELRLDKLENDREGTETFASATPGEPASDTSRFDGLNSIDYANLVYSAPEQAKRDKARSG